jgi:thioredoxin 1
MSPRSRILVVLVLAVAATLLYVKRPAVQDNSPPTGAGAVAEVKLPRLVDLGADKCVPCKMMAPILDQMKTEFATTFAVEFIDVWKNPEAAEPYGIRVIPTQIFFAADGSELFRHEGFFSREDILAKWRELGVDTGAI